MTVFSELRMQPMVLPRRGWDAALTARLVLAGVVLSTLLIGANLATPVYSLLQARLGLSPLDVTVAFSSYVLSLVAALIVAGHWSDHIGRRAALVVAVVIGLAGSLTFAFAQNLLMLSAGRALQGAAVALATGASSAALRELLPHRPEWASRFTLLASSGGVAAGPVIGGMLSVLPDPTRLPFFLHTAVLLLLLVPLLLLKARPAIRPADAGKALASLRPRSLAISRQARAAFWLAAVVGFVSFAVFGFTLSLAPTYFAGIVHTDSRAAIGVLAALPLAASAASQLLSLRSRWIVPAGLALLGGGVVLVPMAGAASSPLLLVAAGLAAGLGQGAAFRVVFNEVAARVEADRHAQVISAVYVITYLGSAVPVIGMGAAATVIGLPAAVAGFAVFVVPACAVLAVVSAAAGPRARACD